MFLYSKSAKHGNSQSTNLSYKSPTFCINPCFRACSSTASHGFKTRPSRNLISAGAKPSLSARNIHLSPPKSKNAKILSPGNNIFFHSLDLESSSKNLNDYLPKSFCTVPVRPRFGILRQREHESDRLSALLYPAYLRGRFKFIVQGISRRERLNESLLRRI